MKEDKVAVGIGEVLWDMLPGGKQIGGAPANFAYHAGRFGVKSCVVSAVGNDSLGDELLAQLSDRGLHTLISTVDFPTGTVAVSIDKIGIPTYDITEGVAWDNIPWSADLEALAGRTCAVSFGSLAQRSEVSRLTIYRFLDAVSDSALKVFDINLRLDFYTPEIITESLKRCNVLKINDEELDVIARMFGCPDSDRERICMTLLRDHDLKILILTCGTDGSYVYTADGVSFVETPRVDVADTVGAGDSFTGAFIAALIRGRSVGEAHRLAVDVAAHVCSCSGAMPPMPDALVGRIAVG